MLKPLRTALLIAATSLLALPVAAQEIVPPGSKVVLTVEYEYKTKGLRKDKYDSNEWDILRKAAVKSTLVAEKPLPLPGLHKMEAGQTADLANKQAAAASAAKTMQPMMNDVMAIMEKCGEDEACIEAAVMGYGMGNAGEINKTREKAAPDFATVAKQDAPRYQVWTPTGQQTGTYKISEKMSYVDADPICQVHQSKRCNTTVTREGGGKIGLPPGMKASDRQAAGFAMGEIDSVGGTMMLTLPVPMMVLDYIELVISDDPETENGNWDRTIRFPPVKDADLKVSVPVKGKLAGQAGMKKVAIKGSHGGDRTLNPTAGEDGELVIRWSFAAG